MSSACRILLVEDHDWSRAALEQLLSRQGFVVCAVSTLAGAQAALDGQDAVLLDLNLPDGSGGDLLKRIRGEHRPIKVAVSSAVPAQSARQRAKDADLYIQKPITPEKLETLVNWLRANAIKAQ